MFFHESVDSSRNGHLEVDLRVTQDDFDVKDLDEISLCSVEELEHDRFLLPSLLPLGEAKSELFDPLSPLSMTKKGLLSS